MTIVVSVPGTLGEWVQGWIGDKGEALVSCVVSRQGRTLLQKGREDEPLPEKARAALVMAQEEFHVSLAGGGLSLHNPLPLSLGLASSTVDVCGVFAAVAALGGRSLSEEKLFSLCCRIEPSDGVMFSGLVLVDHLGGRLLERLPAPPSLWLASLLPRRILDTDAYRRDPLFVDRIRRQEARHRKAYRVFREGVLKGNLPLIGAGAAESALIQQDILPREEWPLLEACRKECGGLGIVVAHSGTASAVLFGSDIEARRGCDWFSSRWDGGDVECLKPRGGDVRILVDNVRVPLSGEKYVP